MSQSGLEDILSLSPLQEGMLFHSVYDATAPDVYAAQLVVDLEGPLDREALRAAASALLARHGNLAAQPGRPASGKRQERIGTLQQSRAATKARQAER